MSALPPGTRVGPYEVISAIGAGGMGQVFRARDTALHREVALKILPPGVGNDAEYRARFSREARALAALNHPHIAQVYGLEDSVAGPAIVMELVSGTTLRERLRSGVARADALRLASQIAMALDVAHEKGIVHRDLKPGNIMVTPDGAAKVLDFGLAKAMTAPETPADHDTTFANTVEGLVVGTPGYMSPEQARGQVVDRRTDIWAFGCVLYELLAGRPAFGGESSSDLVAAILERDPDWRALPPDVPPHIRRLVQRCLEKDRRLRLRDIGDALPELSATYDVINTPVPPTPRSVGGRMAIAIVFGAIAMGSIVTWLVMPDASTEGTTAGSSLVRFALAPPTGARFVGSVPTIEATTLAVSPDGATIAFIAARSGEPARVWVRALGDEAARELTGTDGAISMFWSPDGQSLAFVVSGQLKRLDLSGGAAVKICDVPVNVGVSGSWGRDGQILFATIQGDRLLRVPSAGGGTPVEVMSASVGPTRVLWPSYLPDGRRFVYTEIVIGSQSRIMLADPDGRRIPLVTAASLAQWVDPDWLIFVREGTLVGQRVDLAAGQVVGEPASILGSVAYSAATGWANVSASSNGTLAAQWILDESRVAWFDRTGREGALVGTPGAYGTLRLSPDDSSLLSTRVRQDLGTRDIWATDLARGAESQVTTSPAMDTGEVWLPDGRAIVYAAAQAGPPNLFHRNLATGQERRLLTDPRFQFPNDVSTDGLQVVYQQRTALGNFDLLRVSIADPSRVEPLLVSPASEHSARVAPGGTWMSFTSDESGRPQVYVTAFQVPGKRTPVSTAGGTMGRWRRDGRELYFISRSGQLTAATIDASGVPGPLRPLFEVKDWLDYDVARDGRFLAVVSQKVTAEQPLAVFVNWSQSGRK